TSDACSNVAADILEGTASLFAFVGRFDLASSELTALLQKTECFSSIHSDCDPPKTSLTKRGQHVNERCVSLGVKEQQASTLRLTLKPGPLPLAVFQAIEVIVDKLKRLEAVQAAEDDRLSIWPYGESEDYGDWTVSGQMRDIISYARRVAKTNVTVLITGESGTGKEIVARAIHDASDRVHRPFGPFNCTAIPRDLLESHLFGHRRGAFTGADRDQLGLIRAARDGTLFLDEIGELGLELQPKLLRFLESGEISTLGESGPTKVNVRIIAATNRNLADLVRTGHFREDLFYRLNVVRLTVRPLRERRDEIPGLIAAFVARAADEFN